MRTIDLVKLVLLGLVIYTLLKELNQHVDSLGYNSQTEISQLGQNNNITSQDLGSILEAALDKTFGRCILASTSFTHRPLETTSLSTGLPLHFSVPTFTLTI